MLKDDQDFLKELQVVMRAHHDAIRLYVRQGFKRSFMSKLYGNTGG